LSLVEFPSLYDYAYQGVAFAAEKICATTLWLSDKVEHSLIFNQVNAFNLEKSSFFQLILTIPYREQVD